MTTEEKLKLIESVLHEKPNTLSESTKLSALRTWDSLAILSLQIELTAIKPELMFDSLFQCNTVGDICKMI